MRQAVFAIVLLACATSLAGCLPETKFPRPGREDVRAEARWQRELYARELLKLGVRVDRIAAGIMENSLELCGERVTYGVWFSVFGLGEIKDSPWRKAWEAVLGPEERLRVVNVVESGPAWNAGVRPGDVLLAVGNATVPDDPRWFGDVRKMIREIVEQGKPLPLTLEREGQSFEIEVAPVLCCDYPIELNPLDEINAYADGERIIINQGLVNFVDTEEQLAATVGHELAHNAIGHMRKRMFHSSLAKLLDGMVDGATFSLFPSNIFQKAVHGPLSVEQEFEADYVGMYMTARAGYDLTSIPDDFRKMALKDPASIARDTTHPGYAKRVAALEATIQEIEAKKRAGQALWPEFKTHMYEELVEAARKKIEKLKKKLARKDD